MSYGELREPIHCTTEQFWQAMCRPNFVRTGLHTGIIGLGQFYCEAPPEQQEGFLLAKRRETMVLLGAGAYELAKFDAAAKGLPPPPMPWSRRLWEWMRGGA